MNNNSNYIPPAIKFYSSFDEALSADPGWDQYLLYKEAKWEFKDLSNFPRTFIVAEPGYGKTRLLEEIVLRATDEGKKAIYVECKRIMETTVEEFILNQAKKVSAVQTDKFELKNEENIIICFDALDEVKLEDFSCTVEKIKTFLTNTKKLRQLFPVDGIFSRNINNCLPILISDMLVFPLFQRSRLNYISNVIQSHKKI